MVPFRHFIFSTIVAGLLAFLAKPSIKTFYLSGVAQGTTYHITYFATDSFFTKGEADSIFASLDSSLSIYKSYSIISQFNISKRGIKVDQHIKKVIERSLQISQDSKGIFDITVYPLVAAWGFGPSGKMSEGIPTAKAIKNILSYTGYKKIFLKKDSLIKKNPKTKIDVNGIAQGYSVDVITQFLNKKNIENYIVEVGGEIRVKGCKQPIGKRFKIGIEAPPQNNQDDEVMIRSIELAKGSVTTSGKYRKFYLNGNKKISHLINPLTGYPLCNEIISATVYANDAITADGYDNVLMSLHINEAFQFLTTHPFIEAYFIYIKKDGSVADTASAGFNKLFCKK